jgi:hypothetical protein
MQLKTLKYIFIPFISLFFSISLQGKGKDSTKVEIVMVNLSEQEAPVFGGVSLSADLVGVVMKALKSDYAQMEVAARLNFKEKYFPVFELGYGSCDYEGAESGNTFNTQAPYFRIGMDYNFTKKWWKGNRLYAGVRYAFSSYQYDISSPRFFDPVWETECPFVYKDLKGTSHWGEVVFGIETRIWKFFHLGWNVRYKLLFSEKGSSIGNPWYIPGFGKFGTSGLGGTFNIIFDI